MNKKPSFKVCYKEEPLLVSVDKNIGDEGERLITLSYVILKDHEGIKKLIKQYRNVAGYDDKFILFDGDPYIVSSIEEIREYSYIDTSYAGTFTAKLISREEWWK